MLTASRIARTEEDPMSTDALDAFVRQTSAIVSRRTSLRILGRAPLAAALMRPSAVGGKKSGNKSKKQAKKKAQQRCLAQAGQCRAFFAGRCELPDPGECEARIARCCGFLGSCDTTSFLTCLLETS
jgi:hypothetical protein